jgi:hypothetical protein
MNLYDHLNNAFNFYTDMLFEQPNPHIFFSNNIEINFYKLLFNQINNQYNKSETTPQVESVKEDMIIKVFVLKHCILRICSRTNYDKYYCQTYEYIKNLSHKNLETIFNLFINANYVIIISKKIIPLITSTKNPSKHGYIINSLLSINLQKLIIQIALVLYKINSDGYSHNDACLDNIGFDEDSQNFVLFDFDKFTNVSKSANHDISKFQKSLENWKLNYNIIHALK